MSLWKYTACGIGDGSGGGSSLKRGEMPGETASEVRAALRRLGLQVIDLKPVRRSTQTNRSAVFSSLTEILNQHHRKRRQSLKVELFDALATMLQSGLPLLEALGAMLDESGGSRPRRVMLRQVAHALESGQTLNEAMIDHPSWFDGAEIAMVASGLHSGELASVLTALADQRTQADELSQKLVGALAYPIIVALTGLGVAAFLSVKTMPQLAGILTQADVPIPGLTKAMMTFGQFLVTSGMVLLPSLMLGCFIAMVCYQAMSKRGVLPSWMVNGVSRLRPRVMRRLAVARMARQLAELSQCGVPLAEAMRVTAPTLPKSLGVILKTAALRLEQGDPLPGVFDDTRWFDGEFRRLIEVGQVSGELPVLLERLGLRYERQSRRLIERLAALLEPAVIIALACGVGLVVMAAILPLVRMQEIL